MRLQEDLERFGWPRLQMLLIVALTGAVGFVSSFALLHSGVTSLWERYPIAVALAYFGFLFFLWCWLRLDADDVVNWVDLPGNVPTGGGRGGGCGASKPFEAGGGHYGGGGASSSFHAADVAQFPEAHAGIMDAGVSDLAGGLSALEELGVVLLVLAALVGAACAVVWIIWAAPSLLAELSFDAALMTGLYHRLGRVERRHWLETALERTWLPFAGVALMFALAGAAMHLYAPEARSMHQVVAHYHGVHR
jgi:hypothetical protein